MTNTDMSKEREALEAYLKDCDKCQIVPDVGGAWHAAFQAGRASLPAAGQEPVGYWDGEFSSDGGATLYEVPQVSAFGRKYRNAPLYAAPQPAVAAGNLEDSVKHAHEILGRLGYHRDGDHFVNVNRAGAEAMHVSTIATIVNASLIAALPPAPSNEGERNG